MPLRTVHAKIKQNNQTLTERDLLLDPRDDRQVRDALLTALGSLGEDPSGRHRIELYLDGVFLREMHAA